MAEKTTDTETPAVEETAAPEAEAPEAKPNGNARTCPHCGSALREHHDSLNALHCDSPNCAQCCFLPGPAGRLLLRPGSPACPSF
jgi:hypothetical protein